MSMHVWYMVKYVLYVWVNGAWYFPLRHTGRLMKGSQQNTDPLFMQPSLHHKQQIKRMHNAKLNLSRHKEPVPWRALGKGLCIGYFISTLSSLDPMTFILGIQTNLNWTSSYTWSKQAGSWHWFRLDPGDVTHRVVGDPHVHFHLQGFLSLRTQTTKANTVSHVALTFSPTSKHKGPDPVTCIHGQVMVYSGWKLQSRKLQFKISVCVPVSFHITWLYIPVYILVGVYFLLLDCILCEYTHAILTCCLFFSSRDASFGNCTYNLTVLDSLQGIRKVRYTL